MPLHRRTVHPQFVEDCFGCRVASVQVGATVAATTDSGEQAQATNRMEAGWAKDMPAYKRLRDQGYQPPRIDGCAELEQRATHPHEIASGTIYSGERTKTALRDALEMVNVAPATTPVG